MRGLSLVAASRGHSSSQCAGLSLSRPLLLRSTGSRHAGSAIVAHGPSRSAACGIFPDQGSNPCPLHWQADSQPLRHQGSPLLFLKYKIHCIWSRIKVSFYRLQIYLFKGLNLFKVFRYGTFQRIYKTGNKLMMSLMGRKLWHCSSPLKHKNEEKKLWNAHGT